jgi:alcohol dehydrogenase (cytochrome c)
VTIAKAITTVTIFLCCSAVLAAPEKRATISALIDVRPDQLFVQPPGANWLSYNGDYAGRRFRSLSEITPDNVTNLRAEWILHARDANELEVTPVVVDGIMFVNSANDAFALEARTGRSLWHYSCPVTEGLIDDASQHHNRGVAVWRSKVLLHCRKNAVKFNRYKPPSILSECEGAEGRERIENAFKSVYS